MPVVVASQHHSSQGDCGVLTSPAATAGLISGRNPNTTTGLLVSSVPIPASSPPCPIASYIQISERHLGGINESSMTKGLMNTPKSQNSDENSPSSFSLVAIFHALYLPFLWRTLCGGFDILRYVLMGQLFEQPHEESPVSGVPVSSYALLFSAMVESPAVASCLTCLGLLACVALAVHPDGLTWMAVRKLRELLMSILHSSSTCWAWLLNDETGVISTIFALATFCALFFFCYVLHRTLAPKKQPRRVIHTDFSSGNPLCTIPTKSYETSPSCTTTKKKKKKKTSAKKRIATPIKATTNENLPASRYQSPVPTQQPLKTGVQELSELLSSDENEAILPGSVSSRTSTETTSTNDSSGTSTRSAGEIAQTPTLATRKTALRYEQNFPRLRASSTSTIETVASSVPEDESLVIPLPSQNQQKHRNQGNHRTKKPTNNLSKRGGRSGYSNYNHYPNHDASSPQIIDELVVGSRWDALKPEPQVVGSRTVRLPHINTVKQNSGSASSPDSSRQQKSRENAPGVPSSSPPPPPHRSTDVSESMQREDTMPEAIQRYNVGSADTIRDSPEYQQPVESLLLPLQNNESSSTSARYHEYFLSPLPLPPQSPSDSFFSSTLNPQSPAFAPSTPPKLLRAPPGLCLPAPEPSQPQQPVPFLHNRMSDFFAPPLSSSSSYYGYDRFLTSAGAASPPPGLLVSTGATLPPGSSSPLCFRSSIGSVVPDNPFQGDEDNEAQIEAELQELGGRMIGSILDS